MAEPTIPSDKVKKIKKDKRKYKEQQNYTCLVM